MMVTYKVLLDTRRAKSDGTYSVIIRITFNRKSITVTTGVFIQKEYWIETKSIICSTHANHKLLNKKITEAYLKVQKGVIELESDEEFSFDAYRERVSGGLKKPNRSNNCCFKQYANQLITEMFSMNKAGNAIIYQTATNRLMTYASKPILKFTEITYSFLDGFRRQLIMDRVKQNTISNYFRTVRAIYNKAVRMKLVDRSHYPFLDIPIKTERTAKRALKHDDLIKLYNATYKPLTPKWNARNYFLLSFCLRGVSFTDLTYLTSDNINKGRLVYKRRKTGSELNIKLLPLAVDIFSFYSGANDKYLLPSLRKDIVEDSLAAKKVIYQWIKTTNKWLNRIATDCSIDAEITTYVTRHSWATTAKRLGYSNELIAECLGHQYGNKITNIYLDDFDQILIDEINERVVSCIEPCRKRLILPYKFSINYSSIQHRTLLRITLLNKSLKPVTGIAG